MLADRSPGRSNRVLPAEVTKRDDICHPDPHRGQHVASRRELYLAPMMCLASRSHAPHAMAYWYRPVRIDVCSMFARMPRHAPAASGIRSAARMRETGQNGSSRHVLALHDGSSKRINEQTSGLLIRGFGVQVPGGAPVLTWPYSFRAIRLLSLWGMDGAFLGHARARRPTCGTSAREPGCLPSQGFELLELTSGSSRTRWRLPGCGSRARRRAWFPGRCGPPR